MSCINYRFVLPIELYQSNEYNQLRRAYILLIASLIEEHLIDQDINNYLESIIGIEKSCYNHSVEIADYEMLIPDFDNAHFDQLYRTRITRITKNLDINSEVADDHLIGLIINRNIDIDNISKMKPEELSPSRNEQLLEALSARRNQKMSVKVSTLYKCRQCGKKEATVRSVQMRALDEGDTLVLTCNFCGYKWFN
jgi:DNA-directed RNA polymerase subunit M/transcription elongation factor TFIIS